jgi:DNA replication and repair protein RecF
LAANIVVITNSRVKFLDDLKKYYSDTFKKIFDESCQLNFVLESSVAKNSIENTLKFLNNNIEKELIIGKTQYGIHKDNYLVFFNGLNAIDYCSIGQQKMSYFSLIFAYIELFRYKCSTFPMILMDDISGELDDNRWNKLITHLYDLSMQVIITTANIKFKEKLLNLNKVKILNVVNGTIKNL